MYRVVRGRHIPLGYSYSSSAKPFHQVPSLTLWDTIKFLHPYNEKHLKSTFEGLFLKHGNIVRSRLPGSKYDLVYICEPEDGETLLNSDGQYPIIPGFDFFVAYRNKVTLSNYTQGQGLSSLHRSEALCSEAARDWWGLTARPGTR